jgi:hypothetical protein
MPTLKTHWKEDESTTDPKNPLLMPGVGKFSIDGWSTQVHFGTFVEYQEISNIICAAYNKGRMDTLEELVKREEYVKSKSGGVLGSIKSFFICLRDMFFIVPKND